MAVSLSIHNVFFFFFSLHLSIPGRIGFVIWNPMFSSFFLLSIMLPNITKFVVRLLADL